MKKIPVFMLLFVLFSFAATAAWFEPLDCSALDNNNIVPRTEFGSPADICFYGTGFSDTNVTVKLGDITIVSPITNGVLTSLNGFRFIDVPKGDYTMRVYTSDDMIEYPKEIKVDNGSGNQTEVPEFSTFGMIFVVTIAGLFIALRRRG